MCILKIKCVNFLTFSDLSDNYSSLAFTLLSKMNVEQLSLPNNAKNMSKLLSLIGQSFKRTGPKVTSERQLMHDLHRLV